MTVHIGELTTEVAAENGATPPMPSPAQRTPGWAELDKVRRATEALCRERARVAGEGFDA